CSSDLRVCVGIDDVLIHHVGDFQGDVLGVLLPQVRYLQVLPLGQQPAPGQQCLPDLVQRVVLTPTVPGDGLLQPLAASGDLLSRKLHNVERVHHRDRLGQLGNGGGVVAGKPIHSDDLDAVAEGGSAFFEPGRQNLLRPARAHVRKPVGYGALIHGRDVYQDRGVGFFATASHVGPAVLVDPEDPHSIEMARVVVYQPTT